jgi:UDPglucose 6-dehydrogenase
MDVNGSIVDAVNARRCDSSEPGLAEGLERAADLSATTDMAAAVAEARLIFILVPTPNSGGRDYYNHSILANVLFKLNTLRLRDKHVVISATVIPGFIRGTGRYLLRDCVNTTLSYNPAFVAQGDIMVGYRTGGWFRLVLVGCENEEAGDLLTAVYEKIAPPDVCVCVCVCVWNKCTCART